MEHSSPILDSGTGVAGLPGVPRSPPLPRDSSPSAAPSPMGLPPYQHQGQHVPQAAYMQKHPRPPPSQQTLRTPPPTSSNTRGVGHAPRQESIGESFLRMGPDSSPSEASTSASYSASQSSARYMPSIGNGSSPLGNKSAATLMKKSSSAELASSPLLQQLAWQPPHAPGGPALQMHAGQEASFDPLDSADSGSMRSRGSRGTRLGIQMGKQKAAAAAAAAEAGTSAPYAAAPPTAAPRMAPSHSAGELPYASPVSASVSQSSDITQKHGPHPAAAPRSTADRQFADGSDTASAMQSRAEPRERQHIVTPAPLSEATTNAAPVEAGTGDSPVLDKGKIGHLSDGAIVQLGATPGTDPTTLLNNDGVPLSSKNVLTIALQKAQSAVLLDGTNNVAEAIMAYRQAVRLLQEVMERVSPKQGAAGASISARQASRKHNREEERRRLKVIHDTYADRIRLLSMIWTPEDGDEADQIAETDLIPNVVGGNVNDPTRMGGPNGNQAQDQLRQPTESISDVQAAQTGPIINISREENGIMTPVRNGDLNSADDERRGEEGLSTPATPYFDVDPTLGLQEGEDVDDSDRERQTQRYDSLLEAPLVSARKAQASGTSTQRRAPVVEQQDNQATPPTVAPTPDYSRSLVSPTTSAGAISQRRKISNAASLPYTNPTLSEPITPVDSSNTTPTMSSLAVLVANLPSSPDFNASREHSLELDALNERETREARSFLSSSGRKRAISQPGNRRPNIPASFAPGTASSGRSSGNGPSALPPQEPPPPVPPLMPRITRKASMPLSLLPTVSTMTTNHAKSSSKSGLTIAGHTGTQPLTVPLPSPAPSNYSGYHTLGTPLAAAYSMIGDGSGIGLGMTQYDEKAAIINDLFPTALPSTQLGMPPSYASNAAALSLPWLGVGNALPDPATTMISKPPPSSKALRPFYTMRQLHASIERGAYVTARLFVPREVWHQSGSRLLAVDTKVRMIESVSAAMDGVQQTGAFLLHDTPWHQPGTTTIHVARFVKQLDEIEAMMSEMQSTLAKKLGHTDAGSTAALSAFGVAHSAAGGSPGTGAHGAGQGAGAGSGFKRSNLTTFNALSSKLQRSLNQMVAHNSKSAVDSPTAYVDGLARLFVRAQVLGDHLSALLYARQHQQRNAHSLPTVGVEGYAALSDEMRGSIEVRLRRASAFFANVVLRFVLRDITILVDRSVKRSAALLVE